MSGDPENQHCEFAIDGNIVQIGATIIDSEGNWDNGGISLAEYEIITALANAGFSVNISITPGPSTSDLAMIAITISNASSCPLLKIRTTGLESSADSVLIQLDLT